MYDEPHAANTPSVQQTEERKRPKIDIRGSDLPGMIGTISLIVIAGIVYIAHYYVSEHSASIKFATEAIFSFFALIVIISQAVIYGRQTEIMGTSFRVGNGSKMDVDSIEMTTDDNLETIVLKIGNIGRVPADEIRVWVTAFHQVFNNYKKPLNGARPKHQQGYFWNFGRSKLFPGKLRITLYVPVHKHFAKELEIINEGWARFIVQIKILNKDGFGFYESEFAFRFTVQTGTKPAAWLVYPVRNQEDLLADLFQGENEQPHYYDIEQPRPN